jgi:hypothetical protein
VTAILVVNAGSSSLKLRLLDQRDEIAAALGLDEWDGSPDTPELTAVAAAASAVLAPPLRRRPARPPVTSACAPANSPSRRPSSRPVAIAKSRL